MRVFLPVVCLAAPLLTAAAVPGPNACFCLANPAGQVVHYGCEAWQVRRTGALYTTCLKSGRSDTEVVDPGGLVRVMAGANACNPCRPPPLQALKDVPRLPQDAQTK